MKSNSKPLRAIVKGLIESSKSALQRINFKAIMLLVGLQVIITAAAFVILGSLPVSREAKRILQQINSSQTPVSSEPFVGKMEIISKIQSALHHEAVLRANLKLSKADSIALLIDIQDSLAVLYFKGVPLFESKISNIVRNQGLKKLPISLRDSLYSGPMRVKKEISTIEKFPIVVKQAPKDTAEANLLPSEPKLPTQSDVFLFFVLGNSMVIEIRQQETELVGQPRDYRHYRNQIYKWLQQKNLSFLTDSQLSGYIYTLTIELPREDARSIYRALPIKPYIVVRY